MAIQNQYEFFGVTGQDLSTPQTMFGTSGGVQLPLISETYILKSLRVVSTGTPVITITDNNITVIKTVALTANVSQELLTQPLIVEGATTLTVGASSASATDVGISFLNIKKSTVD